MTKVNISMLTSLRTLVSKYQTLRSHHLLDDRVSASELQEYLYMSSYVGRKLGFIRSLRESMCVDASGDPLPWYSYPAIDQLAKWDFSGATVFEYGCGNSTRWWAARAAAVVSVESSREWYERILTAHEMPATVTPILSPVSQEDPPEAMMAYARTVEQHGQFDVIVIDGPTWNTGRRLCAEASLPHLRDGGVIILDNADWHPTTAALLREHGLLEIDFTGIGPLNTHAETTSLFLTAGFRPKPVRAEHPGLAVGGLTARHD